MIAPSTYSTTGGGFSAMPCSAGMVTNMPSLVSVEERASPPTGQRTGDYRRAEERQAEHLFLVEGSRANGPILIAVGQDRANDPGNDIAYGQPRPVCVEVVTLTDEALDLHAPSIRMETTKCLVTKTPEKFCGISA